MKNNNVAGRVQQDIGMCILVLSFLLGAIVLAKSGDDSFAEGLIMLGCISVAVLLACFRAVTISIIIASIQTVIFLAIKIYTIFFAGEEVSPLSFAWLILPAIAMTGIILFVNGNKKLIIANEVLTTQVEELVMIDPLTGFYNLRCLFMDMQSQISLAERKDMSICLMIIKLRYPKEMKSVLKKHQYEQVIIRLANIAKKTVRLEDRVYSIDKEGTLGIILTTDKKGARIAEGRLRDRISDPQAFADISEKPLRVEVKIGTLQYVNEEYERDITLFKSKVEEEVEYDI